MPLTPRQVHSRVEVTGLVASAAGDASRGDRDAPGRPAGAWREAHAESAGSAAASDHAAIAARAGRTVGATEVLGLTPSA
jgi:hypothetical protein